MVNQKNKNFFQLKDKSLHPACKIYEDILWYIWRYIVASWCSGYHYCTASFNKDWTQILRRFKSCSRRVGDLRWSWSVTMVPAGNKAKRLLSVNHTSKTIHHHQGKRICGEKYIGETKKNVEIRSMEHNTRSVKSNPAKHLRDNIDHSFTWKVIFNAANRKLARKVLEAYFITTMKPSLNDKNDSDLLHLFRNGIT